MYQVYERANDCPPVEEFIWYQVARDYGDFAGIKSMDRGDLILLRALIDHQLTETKQTKPLSD